MVKNIMNYVITYAIRGYEFCGVFNDEEYAELEERQDHGQLCICEVIEAPGICISGPETED